MLPDADPRSEVGGGGASTASISAAPASVLPVFPLKFDFRLR